MSKQKLFYSLPLVDRLGHVATELFFLQNLYPIEFYDYHIFIPPLAKRPKTNLFMLKKVTEGMTVIETEDESVLMAAYHAGPEVTIEERNGDLYILLDGSQLYYKFLLEFKDRAPNFNYTLSHEENLAGFELRRQFGIPENANLVTLHVRDRGFLPHLNYHSYRDANIENYIPAVEYLLSHGIYVIRIGDPSMKPIQGLPPNFIDAPFHRAYNSFVEPYFIASSFFHLGVISGPQSLALVFNKPMLCTNTLLSIADWGRPNDLMVPRKFFSYKLHRFLTYEEVLFSPMISFWETALYDKAGIQLVENSHQELLEATKEMVRRLVGEFEYQTDADKLNAEMKSVQKRLYEYRQANCLNPPFYSSYFSQAQISHSFIKMNPWFQGHDFGDCS